MLLRINEKRVGTMGPNRLIAMYMYYDMVSAPEPLLGCTALGWPGNQFPAHGHEEVQWQEGEQGSICRCIYELLLPPFRVMLSLSCGIIAAVQKPTNFYHLMTTFRQRAWRRLPQWSRFMVRLCAHRESSCQVTRLKSQRSELTECMLHP